MPMTTYEIEAIGADGRRLTLQITEVEATPQRTLRGKKISGYDREIITETGKPVKRLEPRKYQIEETGEVLTSDDPKAP